MLSAAAPVAKTEDRQLQTPQRRKTAPQTWWLARHSGHAAEPINAFVMRSKPWKPKPSKHASATRLIFAPSPITSASVQVFIRRQSLGLDQGNQQHLISTTFGNPSEVRDLPGGPYHALMPRARQGRLEPPDHFIRGHLYDPWASLCPWVAGCAHQVQPLIYLKGFGVEACGALVSTSKFLAQINKTPKGGYGPCPKKCTLDERTL